MIHFLKFQINTFAFDCFPLEEKLVNHFILKIHKILYELLQKTPVKFDAFSKQTGSFIFLRNEELTL